MRKTAIFPLPIWGRFQFFFIGKAKSPPCFYFWFIWPTDLESVPRVEPPTYVDHFRQVWSWYDYPSPLFVRIRYVTLTFDLLTLDSGQTAGHVGNPSTKFEDPTPIRSWLMSYDVCHRPPLTMRLEPLRMRCITWPVRRGANFPQIFEFPDPDLSLHYATPTALRSTYIELSAKIVYGPVLKANAMSAYAPNHVTCQWESKTITFLESPTPICLFTIQLLWSSDDA